MRAIKEVRLKLWQRMQGEREAIKDSRREDSSGQEDSGTSPPPPTHTPPLSKAGPQGFYEEALMSIPNTAWGPGRAQGPKVPGE